MPLWVRVDPLRKAIIWPHNGNHCFKVDLYNVVRGAVVNLILAAPICRVPSYNLLAQLQVKPANHAEFGGGYIAHEARHDLLQHHLALANQPERHFETF